MKLDERSRNIARETARKYADILHAQRPDSLDSRRKHPRMALENRAKIFSPFSALRGYDEQLEEERERTEWAVTESEMGVELDET